MKIAILTLGCDKNTVDSEYIAGLLSQKAHRIFSPEKETLWDALVINTCGFIDTAKEQNIHTILHWAEEKNRRIRTGLPPFRLYVVGCLAERYGPDLVRLIPEIDGMAGVGRWHDIVRMIDNPTPSQVPLLTSLPAKRPSVRIVKSMPRLKLDQLPYAYLKIADGCSHRCSFCAIPHIKGPYRSVPRKILLKEAEELLQKGVKEINLVGQDVNKYGQDLYKHYDLADLVRDILRFQGEFWVRLLYFYPRPVSARLVSLFQNEKNLCPYVDIPLQHLSPAILRRMGRHHESGRILHMLSGWREEIPDLVIRTTFIVGFPGETKSDFASLLSGVKHFRFDRLGAFLYSPEEGTSAFHYASPVPPRTGLRRLERLMQTQAEISLERNQKQVGRIKRVLIEEKCADKNLYFARSQADAPEVDGMILVHSQKSLQIGSFVNVKISRAYTYDLWASVCD